MKLLLYLMFLSLPLGAAYSQSTLSLQVQVIGLQNSNGRVRICLYNSAEGFPSDPTRAFQQAKTLISNGTAELNLAGLPAGTYALAVLHDENNNGKMDTNFFGLPLEGYGCSRNVRAFLGPPKFKDACFKLDSSNQELKINMQYL